MASRLRHRAIRILDGPHAGETTWKVIGARRFTTGRPVPGHESNPFPPLEDHEYTIDDAGAFDRRVFAWQAGSAPVADSRPVPSCGRLLQPSAR